MLVGFWPAGVKVIDTLGGRRVVGVTKYVARTLYPVLMCDLAARQETAYSGDIIQTMEVIPLILLL